MMRLDFLIITVAREIKLMFGIHHMNLPSGINIHFYMNRRITTGKERRRMKTKETENKYISCVASTSWYSVEQLSLLIDVVRFSLSLYHFVTKRM